MRKYKELKDKLCEELDEITHEIVRKSGLNEKEIETVHKLTDTIKNIDKICMIEEDGYSGDGEWTASGNYGRGNSYAGRRRDSMGRYSRDGSKEHMLSKLEDMMHNADNDKMKSAIRKCINEIERD